jgi:hypothetical protein
MKRVAIYLRVSTSKQDTDNQRHELEAVAARSNWHVVKIYEDAGISGAKGRDKRPGLDAMLKAVNAKEFDMVATWSVDRLGRSLTDLLGILQGLHDKDVDLFLGRGSTHRRLRARRCSRCSACLQSSSAASSGNGSTRVWRWPRRRARSWADVPLSRPLKNAYASSGPKAWAF